jgi:hypothetical protein
VANEIDIDDEFVDVTFPDDPKFVFGALPEPAFGEEEFRDYEDLVNVYTESQAREIVERIDDQGGSNEFYITRVFNQTNEGSCVGNAFTQGHETNQAKQVGIDNVIPISAMSLYQLIGRSASSGAMVSDGAKAIQDVGVLPLDTSENRQKFGNIVMPHTGFRSKRPDGWQAVAKRFRATEVLRVRSVMGLVTAACNGDMIIIGREGHSILYVRPVWLKNGFGFLYVNSWGKWGQAAGKMPYGFGTDTIRQVEKSANVGYAIRTVEIVV